MNFFKETVRNVFFLRVILCIPALYCLLKRTNHGNHRDPYMRRWGVVAVASHTFKSYTSLSKRLIKEFSNFALIVNTALLLKLSAYSTVSKKQNLQKKFQSKKITSFSWFWQRAFKYYLKPHALLKSRKR